jgi:hypothetical protein
MATMSASERFEVPAETLWAVAGRWDHFEEITGEVVRGCVVEQAGRSRRVFLDEGIEIEEPLLHFDHANRTIAWGIGPCKNFDPPIVPQSFVGRFSVRPAGSGSFLDIEWRYELKPGEGAEAEALLRDYFRICFEGTRQTLRARGALS